MSDLRVQQSVVAFDNVTLTDDYTNNEFVLPVGGMEKLTLDIDYAQGASETGNICEFKIEHSTDGTNWYQLVIDDTNTVSDIIGREWNITGDAKLNIIIDIAYKEIKISAKESGVSTNEGSLTMVASVAGR